MSKKNELPALVAALVVTLGVLGAGGLWLKDNIKFDPAPGPIATGPGESNDDQRQRGSYKDYYTGQSVLPEEVSPAKQAGLSALAAGDYETAVATFTTVLAEKKNDPESLIYLSNAQIADEEAYTIAVAVPADKEFLGPALEILRGVAQAQLEINEAGGVNGVPLRVLLAADEGEETSFETASALVETKAVLGVVGHYSSDMTLAAAEAYEVGKLPVISPTSTAESISDAGAYVFRTVPSDRLATATLSRYVLEDLDKTQAAVFYTSDSAYSLSVRREFTTELLSNGGEVVADFDVAKAGYSTRNALEAAQEAGAEVIMLALTEETDDASIQILTVNQKALPVIGGDSLYDYNILEVGGENAVGLTVSVPWHILNYQQSPFVQSSLALWGASVNWRTVTAYDAVVTLAEAITLVGDDREAIAQAMSESGFRVEGATSLVKFFPSGDRNQPSQLVTIVKKESGGISSGTGYDYEPVR